MGHEPRNIYQEELTTCEGGGTEYGDAYAGNSADRFIFDSEW